MNELSYYILDIIQNSIKANSKYISLYVYENDDKIEIKIYDDGIGMTDDELENCTKPYFTTGNKNIGLGLGLFKELCELSSGSFQIESIKNTKTCVKAVFNKNNLNCLPLGNLGETIVILLFNTDVEYNIEYRYDNNSFKIETKELKEILGNLFLLPDLRLKVKEYITQELGKINSIFLNY